MTRVNSVLWQIEQNIASKKLLIKAADEDITRAQHRRAEAIESLKEYEDAFSILKASQADSG
jgi:hypothetical protein